jgi:hypothetical protein
MSDQDTSLIGKRARKETVFEDVLGDVTEDKLEFGPHIERQKCSPVNCAQRIVQERNVRAKIGDSGKINASLLAT